MKKILIIEDNIELIHELVLKLKNKHWKISLAENIEEGCRKVREEKPDLIITDFILPDKNGMEICQKIKNEKINIPVLMLTSKAREISEMMGIEINSDGCSAKYFDINELNEKIDSIFNKREIRKIKEITDYSFENIQLNFKNKKAVKNGNPIDLSEKEYKILRFLIQNCGEVISKDEILDNIWGYDAFPSTHTVDKYMVALRKKIENDPSNPQHLLTVLNNSYKFIN